MGQQTSTTKITPHDKAIFQLKQQRDKLKQYQKRIDHLIAQQSELAKVSITDKDLTKAKFYLKCKKQQLTNLRRTYDQLDTLEGLISTIEFKFVENELVKSLSVGNDILKQLNQQMNVDKIDQLMDDLHEERVKVDEVSDVLGEPLTRVDQEEVDEEFDRLLKEQQPEPNVVVPVADVKNDIKNDTKLPDVPNVIPLPDVPSEVPTEGEVESRSEPLVA